MASVTSRVLYAYAVVLMVSVLGAFAVVGVDNGAGRVLLVPALCSLLVGAMSAAASFLGEGSRARLLALRIAATLPLIVAAALSMRAIRVAKAVDEGAELGSLVPILWGMAGLSFVAFLALQYARFRHGNA